MRKKIQDILKGVEINSRQMGANIDIAGCATDSKEVKEGFIFIAVKGSRHNGHDFIKEALQNGAKAVVSQEDFSNGKDIVKILVSDARKAAAEIAHNFYSRPADKLNIIGITGTNGKTTVSYLIESVLKEAGFNVGVTGTVNYRYNLRQIPATNTTPGALQLVKILHYMATNSADYAVMEVSSHSLQQNRVWGINFKTAAFTNITPEHLDYHKNMQEYRRAKAILFEGLAKDANAVLNIDDEFGRRLSSEVRAHALTYGLGKGADIRPEKFSFSADGTRALVNTPNGRVELHSRLAGKFNLYNILTSIGAAVAEGIDPARTAIGIEAVKSVPGRLEEIAFGQPFKVYVDYAHTDDALKNVLNALREFATGRIITLFGCGGDRDTAKRPRMGAVAGELSDFIVVTTDNPRSEDPKAIADEVVSGIPKNRPGRSFVILDRQEAIKKAIGLAQTGDIVLLAGKGHETYQIFKNMVQPFDDREAAKKALTDLGYASLCLR